MSKFISIIEETAHGVLFELKKLENQHPKINKVIIKNDENDLGMNEDFTKTILHTKYGLSLEIEETPNENIIPPKYEYRTEGYNPTECDNLNRKN